MWISYNDTKVTIYMINYSLAQGAWSYSNDTEHDQYPFAHGYFITIQNGNDMHSII